jgi:hypothetical protein
MKLVTGIEAIQSGKPFKYKDCNDWLSPDGCLGGVTSSDLLRKEFIIKEEPREFWINILAGQVYEGDPINVDVSGRGWIRVREISND